MERFFSKNQRREIAMDGQQLIIELLYKIYLRNHIISSDFEERLIADENILEASRVLQAITTNINLKAFVSIIEKIIFLDPDTFLTTPYTNTGTVEIIDFRTGALKGRNRNFFFSDVNVGFASTLSLFEESPITDFSSNQYLLLWKQIENYIERVLSSTNDLTPFFQIIENRDKNHGILINKSGLINDSKRLYSYIYLNTLNFEGRLSLDNELKYSNRTINPTLTINPITTYEQYIDVLDVLNEVNHTNDIVNRFLKIYHVLEYLTYRVTLSKIVTQVEQSKSFIRKIIQLSDKIKKSESDVFVTNFIKLFQGKEGVFNAKITPFLTPTNRSEIKELYLDKTFDPNILRHNAELIYGIRCSIVHNKESENHISISNPNDYINLIPIIRAYIELLEDLIIEKVSVNDPLIQYSKEQLNFY